MFIPGMNEHLKLLSGPQPLMLGATDGLAILGEATSVFAYIDSYFKRWGCDVAQLPTPAMRMQVYELVRDSTIAEMFGSPGAELDALCLTQSQIIRFVKDFPDWLRQEGHGTFFLIRAGEKHFAAPVFLFHDGRLGVHLRPYSLARRFRAGKRHRLVLPERQ